MMQCKVQKAPSLLRCSILLYILLSAEDILAKKHVDHLYTVSCYVCNTTSHNDCMNIVRTQQKYLEDCSTFSCSVYEYEDPLHLGVVQRVHQCGEPPFSCALIRNPGCCSCHTNGCNHNPRCAADARFDARNCFMNYVLIALILYLIR